ncbi:MAG: dephospho-CoA kinase [Aliishimia sp.]
MFKLGLTGSIGMGKSTTAAMFADLGCAVWDADAAVHRLYSKDGAAVSVFEDRLPDAVEDGEISRLRLKEMIAKDHSVLKEIEAIVHPLVAIDRQSFMHAAITDIVVLDIPLLFETGGEKKVDAVACVYIDTDTQKQRVLDRGTMTEDQFEMIRSKQMPADTKRTKADFVIQTDTLEHARAQVKAIVKTIREGLSDA